jgi:hypothetical protein
VFNLLRSLYWKLTKPYRWKKTLEREKLVIRDLRNKLIDKYQNLLEKYRESTLPPIVSNGTRYIWFMWWQGLENMPEVIRINHEALLQNAGEFNVVFLDEKSYEHWIQLPDYILTKVENGTISITHLSDLLRSLLLSEYGGLWLDATIHVTKPIKNFSDLTYWSPKWTIDKNQKKRYKLWNGLWAISSVKELTLTQCMGVWYSCKSNPIFQCLSYFWLEYWKNENDKPYYWTTEVFLIGCMYDRIDVVKRQIDNLGENNARIFDLALIINKSFNEKKFIQYFSRTNYFYLRWKSDYVEYTQSGKLTLYGNLKRNPMFLCNIN